MMELRRVIVLSWCVALGVAITPCAYSATIRVPQDRPTIQSGIDAAAQGDTVLISDGTYAGPGNTNLVFRNVDITLRSEHGNQHTIIDCEDKARALFVLGPLTEACIIEGLAVVNGQSLDDGLGGGAMFVGGSSPTIVNCRFVACNAAGTSNGTGGGGAIIFHSSRSQVLNCAFVDNTAGWLGGAMVANSSELVIRGCQFRGNRAIGGESVGGAMAIWTPGSKVGPRISHCDFNRNEAEDSGGAILAQDARIDTCTITENRAQVGGGVYLIDCIIARSTIAGNSASLHGGGYAGGGGESAVTECVFERNTAVATGGGLRLFGGCQVTNSFVAVNSANVGGGAACWRGSSSFINCTILMNSAAQGSGLAFLDFESSFPYFVTRSIITWGVGGAALSCTQFSPVVAECTNIYENEGGDWVDCVEGQFGMKGNVSADPLFCQYRTDSHLCSDSPCAPEHSGQCGLIGAFPVGCGNCVIQALAPSTWGQIKHQAAKLGRSSRKERR